MVKKAEPFKRQPHKMVQHTQTICRIYSEPCDKGSSSIQ